MNNIRFWAAGLCCLVYILGYSIAAPARKAAPATIVRGKIKAASKAPRPRSVPYKDAVIALHLTEVKALRGKFATKQIVVFVWGMRDNKLTPAASLKPGKIIKIAIQPWEKMEGRYGGYSRRELDDEAAMALDTYWGEIQK